ncbi:MAG TPA: tetratricopeptide repeat protein [Acidobacteriaceae bacterium]|jgi:tetratricopeptide (TPR) repeat protein|nr:tetratricopeptide repeat protein [Acidobacteriaceae bacterium]
MNRIARTPVLAAALVSMLVSLTGCDKLKARDQLNKGVDAYKAGKYEESVRHFQQAEQLDPQLANAKAFLATALSQNVVPGLTTPDNLKVAQQAIDTYQQTLQQDPNNIISMKGIASLYFNIKKLDEAKDWQKKVLQADPKDPEAAYTIGVIDWTQARVNLMKITDNQDDGAGNAKLLVKTKCSDVKAQNGPLVDEALKYLNQAIENRPSYDDAMSYMNLVYRRKADVDCGDDDARKADVAAADDWGHKALGTRKENEAKKEKANGGGIVLDQNGNMK